MLPPAIRAIIRDWLNANHIILNGRQRTVLIDSDCGRAVAIPTIWAAMRATLENIAYLPVRTMIPVHGQPLTDVGAALEHSLQRLAAFARDELRMIRHVLEVSFVISLTDRRRLPVHELADLIVGDLDRSGAVRRLGGFLFAA